MPRKKTAPPPSEGDAFAVPLADGRYTVCRVLLDATSDAAKRWDGDCVLVACSAWIGEEVPRPDDPALRPILHLTRESWGGKPAILWISDPVPDDFIPIGRILPTPEETATECFIIGGWVWTAMQPLMQWRWDRHRAAVLAEDKEDHAQAAARREKAAAERRAYLSGVTLADLLAHEFFPKWDVYPPAEATRASRELMAATVRRLVGLGKAATEEDRKTVLRECIESFNGLDAKLGLFETMEREDIRAEFEAIVHACGLGRYEDLADQWREW
jgi:hypothetical protein